MLAHLEMCVAGIFRDLHWNGTKIDGLVGFIPRVPINVGCSIFNNIPPMRD